jgi:hypothetical protein
MINIFFSSYIIKMLGCDQQKCTCPNCPNCPYRQEFERSSRPVQSPQSLFLQNLFRPLPPTKPATSLSSSFVLNTLNGKGQAKLAVTHDGKKKEKQWVIENNLPIWECQVCNKKNKIDELKCGACEDDRPKRRESSEVSKCAKCDENAATEGGVCAMCEEDDGDDSCEKDNNSEDSEDDSDDSESGSEDSSETVECKDCAVPIEKGSQCSTCADGKCADCETGNAIEGGLLCIECIATKHGLKCQKCGEGSKLSAKKNGGRSKKQHRTAQSNTRNTGGEKKSGKKSTRSQRQRQRQRRKSSPGRS